MLYQVTYGEIRLHMFRSIYLMLYQVILGEFRLYRDVRLSCFVRRVQVCSV
jgi:hypothetical protein